VLDQVVQFINSSNGTIAYQWNFGDGNSSLDDEPTHRYAASGDYLVQLLASNGYCADTAYGYVNIDPLLRVYVPNAFTPGINGINDTFYPQGEGIEPDSYVMHIYDRWGKLVWQTGNFASRWDGRHYKSLEPMQTGVYTYHIRFRKLADLDGFKITGAVHLIGIE
jgi:gliding motility-associated-like protein